ncbi:MAG: RNA polymerase sigma factor [Pedosphaera sp.]|nr:RNA polymerase sigma factor [Pedosphaera sp.]MSU43060.1 RNA polymerase sigma factor [Pedosphaera sp.]
MDEQSDHELIRAVLGGSASSFEPLIARHQPRVFATARRYARREIEVEDIVQEVFIKAFRRLSSFRADAPFEHWLMRITVHTCYDFLRNHERNREYNITDISDVEEDWLDKVGDDEADRTQVNRAAAKQLLDRLIAGLSSKDAMIITMLDLEEKSVKEIAALTGWSESMIKVRAHRARLEMRKMLARIAPEKYL